MGGSKPAEVGNLQVEWVPIDSVKLDPENARKHSRRNIASIKASLSEFGLQKPIVVGPDGVVLAGNGTLMAARELGWTQIGIVRSTLTGARLTAFGIADNRTGELAEWDEGRLLAALGSVKQDGIEAETLGFNEDDVRELQRVAGVLTEQATSFLDAFLDEVNGERGQDEADYDGQPGGGVLPPDDEHHFQLAYTVTEEQRTIIAAAIRHAKEKHALTTSADALVRVAADYLAKEKE